MDLPRDDFEGPCRYEWKRSEGGPPFDGIEITRDGPGCDKEAMVCCTLTDFLLIESLLILIA